MAEKVPGVEFGVDVDSSGAISAKTTIVNANKDIETSFNRVDVSTKKASDTLKKSSGTISTAVGGMGRKAGQAGIQIQQLVGQIQGGQSVFGALSAQAADLGFVLGFPLLGAVTGLAAALAGTLLPNLFETDDTFKEIVDSVKELEKSQKLTTNQTRLLTTAEQEDLKVKRERISELEKEINKNEELQASREAAQSAIGRRGRAARSDAAQENIAETNILLDQQRAELDGLRQAVGDLAIETSDAEQKKIDAFKRGHKIRLESLTSALSAESDLLSAQAQNRVNIEKGVISELEAQSIERDIQQQNSNNMRFETLVAALEKEKQTILDNEALTREEKLLLINQYDMLEMEAAQNHEANMIAQQQRFSDAMVKIKQREERAKLAAVSGAFSNISQLMNVESRKLFEIGKAAALANATVTGYDAAVTNYKKGSEIGGPPLGAAFAAASLAATFAQIRAIQSTQFGSAGGGQSVQGGQVSNNTNAGGAGPQQQQRIVSIAGINPDDFVRSGSLVDLFNEEVADGAVVKFSFG